MEENEINAFSIADEIILKSPEYIGFFHRIKITNSCLALFDIILFINETYSFSDHPFFNKIQDKIQKTSLKQINQIAYDSVSKENEEQFKELVLQQYQVHLIYELKRILTNIIGEYSLTKIEVLIKYNKPILTDDSILLVSPLIFDESTWKKLILNKLKLSENIELIDINHQKIVAKLDRLKSSIIYGEMPSIKLEDGVKGFEKVLTKDYILVYDFLDSIARKKEWLNLIDLEELKTKVRTDTLLELYNIKKRKKILDNRIKQSKLLISKEKYFKLIVNGLFYLIKKQNPEVSDERVLFSSRIIIRDLFYGYEIKSITDFSIDSIKLNNKILIEYLIFLSQEDKYFEKECQSSIPKIISSNLSFSRRGFSYKNLYKIYKELVIKKNLSFNGTTSPNVLRNEMKKII